MDISTVPAVMNRDKVEENFWESQEHFQTLLEFAPVAILILNPEGRIQSVNAEAVSLFGYNRQELIGQRIEFLIPERFRNMHTNQRQGFTTGNRVRQMGSNLDLYALHKDGTEFPVDVGLNTIQTQSGKLVMTYVIDTTTRIQFQDGLRSANDQLNQSLEKLEQHNRELQLFNEMGEALGSSATIEEAYQVVGRFAGDIFSGRPGALYITNPDKETLEAIVRWGDIPSETAPFHPKLCQALQLDQGFLLQGAENDLCCHHIGRQEIREGITCICSPVKAQIATQFGGQEGFLGVLHLRCDERQDTPHIEKLVVNVAKQATLALSNLALRERLRIQSIRDPMTGLFNRRYMENTLSHEISRAGRYNRPLSIVMLDVDHFKKYNDIYGHTAGDALLEEIGVFLLNNLRQEDIACRYGGEEFILILPDTPQEDGTKLAERIREEIKNLQIDHYGERLGGNTVSIGVASYPENYKNSAAALRAVDRALYQAKLKGRDRVVVGGLKL